MKITDFIADAGRSIPVPTLLVRAIGNEKAAKFLVQILYWMGKGNALGDWIYKHAEDIEKETGIHKRTQHRIRQRLKDLGLLEERHRRLEHRVYFRVNTDQLEAFFEDWNEKEEGQMHDNAIPFNRTILQKTRRQIVCSQSDKMSVGHRTKCPLGTGQNVRSARAG